MLVVVGPRVVPDHVETVRGFAASTGLGVLNTYGVKGLFRWDSPHHLGTIGLQGRDVELAGILDADLVLAVGLDERELGAGELGPRVEVVDPADLDSWAARLGRASDAPVPGRLYAALRAALEPLYAYEAVPLTPAAAAADLGAVLPEGGVICAEPGPVGLWVARALPTTTPLGSVVVPPVAGGPEAVDAALDHASNGRPVVLVVPDPVAAGARAALEQARGAGWPLVVEAWDDGTGARDRGVEAADPGAGVASREQRRQRLAAALAGRRQHHFVVPVDLALTRVLVDVAGPVTAWR